MPCSVGVPKTNSRRVTQTIDDWVAAQLQRFAPLNAVQLDELGQLLGLTPAPVCAAA